MIDYQKVASGVVERLKAEKDFRMWTNEDYHRNFFYTIEVAMMESKKAFLGELEKMLEKKE